MRFSCCFVAVLAIAPSLVAAQQTPASGVTQTNAASMPSASLTIYNENFAVARTTINLDLRAGHNDVSTGEVTTQVEPDSVVLRDPTGKASFQIDEQSYDAAVVSQDWLLKKYEGKTIDFTPGGLGYQDGQFVKPPLIQGTIIRAPQAPSPNNSANYQPTTPLIEVDGKMQFQLPGTPLFPASTDGLLLKPTLRWQIESEKAQKVDAELAYVTSGLNWAATYNVVTGSAVAGSTKAAAGTEKKADLVGWVTITNRTGTDFPQARIKLMAGDVAKIMPNVGGIGRGFAMAAAMNVSQSVQVTQTPFDDFHLYDLNRSVSLTDGETKQVQFIEKQDITVARSYTYDGSAQDRQNFNNNYPGNFVTQQAYGIDLSNSKVRVTEEIKNSQANHLGIPLPAGRLRLYRRDGDGQMQFVGETTINHTPAEDTVKFTSGNAFDVKGSRRQVDFNVDNSRRTALESFEIKLTNQKDEPVTVAVLEHLYRGENWDIQQKSNDFDKVDSRTISFPIAVPAKGEATLTYSVRYTW